MKRYHPIVNLIYFCLVIGCSMFLLHPICLAISLLGAFCYTLHLFGWRKSRKSLGGLLLVMLVTALLNPAFSHQGVTVIAYLPTGNVLTLESVLYGIAAACMLAASLLWFRCASEILTSDKIVYLFGKSFPVLALLLSMILGFVPKMQRKFLEIKRYSGNNYIESISALITWALDDAMHMGDSMKGRGYGLDGRTFFSIYRFTKRDMAKTGLLIVASVYIVLGCIYGGLEWNYYPEIAGSGMEIYPFSIYLVYAWVCVSPVIEGYLEERKWNRLQSKI